MHFKFTIIFAFLAGFLLVANTRPLFAQDALETDPGFLDMNAFDEQFFYSKASLQVNIKGKLMRLVAEASREQDPELAELLDRLRAIQIRAYPMTRQQLRSMELQTEKISERLTERGWDSVVRVRDYGQYVDVYVKENPEFIEGLMMLAVDNSVNETILINIVGDIEPEELGRIGSKFDIEPLEDALSNY